MSALSATAKLEYYIQLGNALPPSVVVNEQNHDRRQTTAIEAFEALRPGDAYEALLGVQIVLCGAHAVEIMREAGFYRDDFAKVKCCRAQAASLMREGRSAKRILVQEQKVRLAVEAVSDAVPAQPAVASLPAPQAEPQALTPVKAAPSPVKAAAAPRAVPPAVAQPRPAVIQAAPSAARVASASPPSAEAIAKAEVFADENIEAAARIRRDRGITPQSRAQFRDVTMPGDPAVIDALVRGTSDLLTLLDEAGVQMLAAD